jgi:DNA polymerase I
MAHHQELVVIDGTALLFRAFFGGASGRDEDGVDIGAVRAVARRLVDQQVGQPASHVAIVYDAGQRTFRNDLAPSYKANRGDPPPALVPQFSRVQAVSRALGMRSFMVPGFEADDLAATLARLGREAGLPVRLLSVDKDLAQLVTDDAPPVLQEDPWTGRSWDGAGVMERLGVPPEKVVALQSLCGDSTDNVPGVKGVGMKTAGALFQHFDGLDDLFDGLDEVAGLPIRGARTLGAKLAAGQEAAYATRALVELRADVPMGDGDIVSSCRFEGVADLAPLEAIRIDGMARRLDRAVVA